MLFTVPVPIDEYLNDDTEIRFMRTWRDCVEDRVQRTAEEWEVENAARGGYTCCQCGVTIKEAHFHIGPYHSTPLLCSEGCAIRDVQKIMYDRQSSNMLRELTESEEE